MDNPPPQRPQPVAEPGAHPLEQALYQVKKTIVGQDQLLERMCVAAQGKLSNYDTDLLRSLVEQAARIADKPYRGSMSPDDVSRRSMTAIVCKSCRS